MVKQIITKMAVVKKAGKKKGTVYRSPRIYLPTKLTDDSTFPFFEGQWIKIEVVGGGLTVRAVRSKGGGGRRKIARGVRD
jgi:hypothetical protein